MIATTANQVEAIVYLACITQPFRKAVQVKRYSDVICLATNKMHSTDDKLHVIFGTLFSYRTVRIRQMR